MEQSTTYLNVHTRLTEHHQQSTTINHSSIHHPHVSNILLSTEILYYNQHARPLPEIRTGSNVAIQNTSTRRRDIYGVVTVIGPHHPCFIKTASGHVLVRNCHFLRRHVPITSPTIVTEPPHFESLQDRPTVNCLPPFLPTQAAPTTGTSVPLVVPRHSKRPHKKPSRLIEEM